MFSDESLRMCLGGILPPEDTGTGNGGTGRPLAMVYSPVQEWQALYDNETGLAKGTIFKELDFPFLGGVVRD